MADVKISALPAAGTLAASDVLPMVQPTGTKKVALSVLDGRWLSSATGGTVNGGLTVNPYLAVGTNPAQSGTVRLPTAGAIRWRNAANTADTGNVRTDASDNLIVGAAGSSVYFTNSSGTVGEMTGSLTIGNTGRFQWGLGVGDTYMARVSAGVVGVGNSLAIGTNPASTGIVRLPKDEYLVARNATNTGDISLLGYGSFGSVLVGNAANTGVWVGSSTSAVVMQGPSLAIGANPASSGIIRLPNNQWIVARNAANSGDVGLLGITAGNLLDIGTTGFQSNVNGTLKHTGTSLGFYNVTPVGRPTLPAAATDPATTMALVNAIRTNLIALGLMQ